MVCHLSDSYLGVMGLRPIKPAGTWVTRNVLRLAALRLPLPWPRGTPTMPEVDQLKFGTPPADFTQDAARLEQLIERFSPPSSQRDFVFAPHPVLGEMTGWEWMRCGYLHSDRHLRQFGDATLLALSSAIPR